jgi:hypothetical protein
MYSASDPTADVLARVQVTDWELGKYLPNY